ncbi:Cocaine esterase [Streptomyces sp. RB5]|uniref:Cocaine esterase n=1 Tax=Streptomyces smaragdinus TaxID=2585196 RepID=A0A7K0CRL6_9ACTN|nr:CocE/NonD family hydrolase [Streptomyces smaragdinus]MQY16135.1 Cocaine esterase [Streptomyces smaragdinus]
MVEPNPPSPVPERREAACVLRDGTRLRTILLIPHGPGPWPALLTRHPYDVTRDEHEGMLDAGRLVAAGYLVALQDVRGRHGSEGVFRPSTQETADGADAVAWLAALPECTGSVGMWGASYASETQFSALLGDAPALRSIAAALSPAMSAFDGFRFRGGVPEIGSTLAWTHHAIAPDLIARTASPDERDAEQARRQVTERALATGDAYRAGALHTDSGAEAIVRWGLDRLRDPFGAESHRAGKIIGRVGAIDVPVLLIGGWFDVFLGSTLEIHRRLLRRAEETGGPVPRLLVGPWSHDNLSGRIAGVDFGPSASAAHRGDGGDLTERHLRWFDATLRGGTQDTPPVRVFLMGADRWIEPPRFPPPHARTLDLHLGAGGSLTPDPSPHPGERRLTSDPANPVPTCGGAVLLFAPYGPGPADQRAIESRPDVLSWRSAPLAGPLTAMGAIHAAIHLTTTGTDADLVVRLCDEHPDGRSTLVADGVRRASARFTDPVTGEGERRPVVPGEELELTVDLWSTAHVFRSGHRIRVDLAPSSSPRWDIGVNAHEPDGVPAPAEHTIRYGTGAPSRLVLTTLPDVPH